MAKVAAVDFANGKRMGMLLLEITRCPHCNVAQPHLAAVWISDGPTTTDDGVRDAHWAAYKCSTCAAIVLARAQYDNRNSAFFRIVTFPHAPRAHEDIPEPARTFLQQAMDTLHAPDAAAVMAGSAVDAMLKVKGLDAGSLYNRIDEALKQNLLTQGMSDWAHSVRLGSNRPRHVDPEKPHVSKEEAKQSVEFATALGSFLFVLTAQIERGVADAQSSTE